MFVKPGVHINQGVSTILFRVRHQLAFTSQNRPNVSNTTCVVIHGKMH